MIGIRLREGFTLAGVTVDDTGFVPVVGYTPPDLATREDYLRWRIAHLRHRRRDLTDDQFRTLLRSQGEPFARYAEDPAWPLPEPRRALTLAEAEAFIASGDADPVMPDLSMLDQGVIPWAA
jgi:hypothetical protein